jgi:hypothetical protein
MIIHKCKCHARRFCWSCIGFTVGFPLEHIIWEKAPLFRLVPPLLGIH